MRGWFFSRVGPSRLAALLVASSLLVPSVHAEDEFGPDEAAGDLGPEADEEDPAGPAEEAEIDDERSAADEEAGVLPLVEIEGSVALEYERIEPEDEASARVSDAFASLDADIIVNLAPNAWLGAVLVFEPVTDPAPGEDRVFEDYGLFAEELYAGLAVGAAELQIGKIAPTFGWAADDAPGLFGGEIAGEYDRFEQLGMNARVSLSEVRGSAGDTTIEHALHLAFFAADTTLLSDSLFTNRGEQGVSDGGVGNTGFPESFAVAYTLQVRDDDELAGPSFQAALRRLAPGEGDRHGEWGVLGAYEDRLTLGRGVWLSPIAEAAYFIHADGEADAAWALTLGAELAKGPYRFSSTWERRAIAADGSEAEYAVTADVGRIFEMPALGEIRADVAYASARDEAGRSHFIGVQFEREFDFRLPR